jgi:hypothetical protein
VKNRIQCKNPLCKDSLPSIWLRRRLHCHRPFCRRNSCDCWRWCCSSWWPNACEVSCIGVRVDSFLHKPLDVLEVPCHSLFEILLGVPNVYLVSQLGTLHTPPYWHFPVPLESLQLQFRTLKSIDSTPSVTFVERSPANIFIQFQYCVDSIWIGLSSIHGLWPL